MYWNIWRKSWAKTKFVQRYYFFFPFFCHMYFSEKKIIVGLHRYIAIISIYPNLPIENCTQTYWKRGLLFKERICSWESKFLILKTSSCLLSAIMQCYTCNSLIFMFLVCHCDLHFISQWFCLHHGNTGPKIIKLFPHSTELSMKSYLLIYSKLLISTIIFLPSLAEFEILCAYMYENANNIGIFIFISRENSMLNWVEHVKNL